ncbi:MAG TPA: alcohol dehydrogenase catalytic domain-containing protein [Ktedonobacteraceae bacterium]|nr:alcohol dehydrogenase catalytic domain-containing protein [Ktedonobacteraceae bacterium]
MRAIVLKGPGEAMLTELEKPAIGPEDVLIRSRAVGICGSDVELYRGIRPEGYYRYPVVPGHEWAGEVVVVGERVHTFAPGDRVASEGFLFCGTCRNCRTGLTNLCEAGYDEIGFTRAGGLAEYVAVPARLVHRLPNNASLEEAALLEPTAVVVHAFLRARPQAGESVVVLGDGTIGLLAVQLARLFSPSLLVLIGSRNERLELGRQLGATHTLNVRESDPEPLIRSLTAGQGADLVFEGGNRPEGVEQALRLARRGGTVALEGIAGSGAPLSIESDIFVLKHLAVLGIFGASAAAWTYAVQIFRAGLLNLAPLITHHFALDEYQAALDILVSHQAKTLKVLIVHKGDQSGD